jgi:type I restriction enzyme M protein
VLTNRKTSDRRGKVQLIDASAYYVPMRKSLGDKRREISDEQIAEIVALYLERPKNEHSSLFDTTDFGYRKVTIERPLRLNFQASEERIQRLWDETDFNNLAKSKKRNPDDKAAEEAQGQQAQQAIIALLHDLPDTRYMDRADFRRDLSAAAKANGIKLAAKINKAIESALSERDENAAICLDKSGKPEPDSSLRDYEYVPLLDSVEDCFEREVLPHVPDAWINREVKDHKDGEVGKVGYEINFNRYFYKYEPPRPLAEIEADIRKLEREIMQMLSEVTK